jgi:predicted PurR-regulated permease PerM
MEEPNNQKSQFEFNQHYFRIAVYIILIVAISAIIIRFTFRWNDLSGIIHSAINVISPFIIGVFLAFILNPMVLWFKNSFFKRFLHIKKNVPALYLSIFLSYVLVFGLLTILLMYVIPQIYSSIVDLTGQINNLYINTTNILNTFQQQHENLTFIDYERIMDTINNAVPQIINYLTGITGSIVPFLYSAASSFLKSVYNVLIAIIISIYVIADQRHLLINSKKLIYALLPEKGRDSIIEVLNHSVRIFGDFVWGKAIDSIIIGLINFIMMTILNLRFAVLISVIVGLSNMIPYFGPFIGGAIGAVILLITSPVNAFVFVIMILILQQFDGIYLGPKILGNSIGIKPLWVIFGITAGGSIGGVVGMFLGVPCVAVLSYILDMFITAKLRQKHLVVVDDNIKVSPPDEKTE